MVSMDHTKVGKAMLRRIAGGTTTGPEFPASNLWAGGPAVIFIVRRPGKASWATLSSTASSKRWRRLASTFPTRSWASRSLLIPTSRTAKSSKIRSWCSSRRWASGPGSRASPAGTLSPCTRSLRPTWRATQRKGLSATSPARG
ncbi:hypothetical protein T484DRAFT_2871066 [Baffinella frigidus]|nr:hypothetical protein T484DRAFT_2871066 [Cryptophyta sp. CCMP2293]